MNDFFYYDNQFLYIELRKILKITKQKIFRKFKKKMLMLIIYFLADNLADNQSRPSYNPSPVVAQAL